MLKRINATAALVLAFMLLFCFITFGAVKADEIADQITILYNSKEHDFSEVDIDYQKVESVESVSELVDVIHLKDAADATQVIERIKNSEGVAAVDNEAIARIDAVPNDKFYEKYQSALKEIGYENVIPGKNPVKVAVVDTGVNADHEDLEGRVEETGYNYVNQDYDTTDMEGHGTFVSGVIAAKTNNSIGIAGASAEADVVVVPYAVLGSDGEGQLSGIAAALEDIALRDDIKVVNLSLGFDGPNDVLEATCQKLKDNGKILVVSSGNYNGSELLYPARYDSVISVGAVNANNERCSGREWGEGFGSNYGEGLDIMAPGDDIASLLDTNEYQLGSGTSYSAPFVSAACALALTKDSNLNFDDMMKGLSTTSKDLFAPGWDKFTGYGLVQLDAFANSFENNPVTNPPVYPPSSELELKLSNSELSTYLGDEPQLTASVDGPATVSWISSNPLVASVSNGRIKPVSTGTTTITARINNGKTATCLVTVKNRLAYQAYTTGLAWMHPVDDGEMAGTTGENHVLEAIRFDRNSINVNAKAHVQNVGWMDSVSSGNTVGTTGQGNHLEAIELSLDPSAASQYDIYYRVYVSGNGWTAWTSNGSPAGTQGHNLALEAVEVKILPKGSQAPNTSGDVDWAFQN